MGLPFGGTAKNYSATGANNNSKFIPEIWSGKLLVKFYDATVLAQISNTDYEGEIKEGGDKVYIRTRPDIIINNYVKGAGLNYQDPESPNIELEIDQAKYFAFKGYDVDKMQADINFMNEFTADGGEQMKIEIDSDVLGAVYADAHADNAGNTAGRKSNDIQLGIAGTPLMLNKSNILDVIVDYGTVLDEQNVPESSRFLIMPPKMCGLVKKSELKDASLSGDGKSLLRNGRLGVIDRFELFTSNLLNVTGGEYDIIFGQKHALTFAAQFEKLEEVRAQNDFGDYIRGLNVYGYEVIKPEALGHSVARLQ